MPRNIREEAALPLDLKIGLAGIGAYLPPTVVTNEHLTADVDTSDEWIRRRTGIQERRVLAPGETILDMALRAARQALDEAGVAPQQLDDIRVGINTWMRFPSLATQVQRGLGAERASAADVSAGCAGFVYALEDAFNRVATEKLLYGRDAVALVIGADGLSHVTNWRDRQTCVLLGDGAGAVVLKRVERGAILAVHTHADGRHGDLLYSDAPFAPQWRSLRGRRFTHKRSAPRPYLHMDGPRVFGLAVRSMVRDVHAVLDKYAQAGGQRLTPADIEYVFPHQANLRMIEAVAEKLALPLERVYTQGVVRYGNTSTASIPIGYNEMRDRRRGRPGAGYEVDVAVGAGFASGAVLRRVE